MSALTVRYPSSYIILYVTPFVCPYVIEIWTNCFNHVNLRLYSKKAYCVIGIFFININNYPMDTWCYTFSKPFTTGALFICLNIHISSRWAKLYRLNGNHLLFNWSAKSFLLLSLICAVQRLCILYHLYRRIWKHIMIHTCACHSSCSIIRYYEFYKYQNNTYKYASQFNKKHTPGKYI